MRTAIERVEPGGVDGVLFDDRLFAGFAALVGALVVAGFVLVLWLLVRNLRILRRAGSDPGALDARARAWHGLRPRLQSGPPLAQRLQELDDLHRRGVITDAEHQLARQQVLGGDERSGR